MCVVVIKMDEDEIVGYCCCGRYKGLNGFLILCDLIVINSKWVGLVNGIVIIMIFVMIFFILVFFFVLFDCIFSF